MDDRRLDDRRLDDRRQATMEPWDTLVREPLPPEPRPGGKVMMLSALAALLVVTVVGTTFLVIRGLRNQGSQTTSSLLGAQATATVPSGTPTPDLTNPVTNGWTQVAPGQFGDVKFAPSSAQRGYLCGAVDATNARSFGVTTDGGQTWQMSTSPAAYDSCSIQISATNPLDIVLNSSPYAGPGPEHYLDAHYSLDGGKTWKAIAIPQNTLVPGGALWAGSYLYVWSGPNKDSGQHGFLQVSTNGGAFSSINPSTLLSGAQNVGIGSAVATSSRFYLNIGYNGCASQNCEAIVASGDGGKTWTQVPNQSSIQLVYVVGAALYGQMIGTGPDAPQIPTEVRSSDNGATWTPLSFPPLPGGQTVVFGQPTPDGSFFTAAPGLGVAYLRGGAWTVIPFSSDRQEGVGVAAVPLGANGHPQRVWAIDGSKYSGVYWHALL